MRRKFLKCSRLENGLDTVLLCNFGCGDHGFDRNLVGQKTKTAVLEEAFFFTDVFRCKHIICTGQNRNGTFTVIFQIDVGLSGFAGFISANSGGGDIFFVQHVENQACVIIISDGSNQMSVAV